MTTDISKEEMLSLSHKTVDYALSKKADAVEVFSFMNSLTQVMTEGQSIANERLKEELGFSIRIIKGDSEGFSYCNKGDLESLKATADDALGIASVAPSNPGLRLPKPSKYKQISGIYTSSVANLTIDELIEDAKTILAPMVEATVDVRTNLSSLTKQEEWYGIVNSQGVEAFEKSNNYAGGFFVVPREGEKVGSFVFDDFFTHDPKSVDLTKFGEELTQRAVRNISAIAPSKIESDTVIFQKDSMFNPIGIVIFQAIAAHNVLQQRSMWKDKLADTVAIQEFNMVDDSLNSDIGGGARSFDDEGTATKQTSIIKDGVLENFLFDELRASKMNAISTGNSWRSLGGPRFMNPPSNIFPNAPLIRGGDQSYEELLEDIKTGITFEYFSGSFRAENGIFSGVAKGAQLIENGELTTPLVNVTIGGNILELLMNIIGMTKELECSNGYMRTPKIKVKGINISTQN